ncbi:MAG: type II toxin-antitoxin system RelB/DinJ family antitoxin [Blautia sp.]|nr:type II toxin-antitoxin system RelB/DinJ family antitoxin [Blautia sp.]MEE0713258.1 type II toxin-antitoxin system RelB/DinJ family antitoxin [Blautia sp.]
MKNVTTSIRIDSNTKQAATELLNELGLDLSSAVNIFLKQVVLQGGLPFQVKYPQYKPEVIEAMEEAEKLSRNPNTKKYSSFSEALEDIDI